MQVRRRAAGRRARPSSPSTRPKQLGIDQPRRLARARQGRRLRRLERRPALDVRRSRSRPGSTARSTSTAPRISRRGPASRRSGRSWSRAPGSCSTPSGGRAARPPTRRARRPRPATPRPASEPPAAPAVPASAPSAPERRPSPAASDARRPTPTPMPRGRRWTRAPGNDRSEHRGSPRSWLGARSWLRLRRRARRRTVHPVAGPDFANGTVSSATASIVAVGGGRGGPGGRQARSTSRANTSIRSLFPPVTVLGLLEIYAVRRDASTRPRSATSTPQARGGPRDQLRLRAPAGRALGGHPRRRRHADRRDRLRLASPP